MNNTRTPEYRLSVLKLAEEMGSVSKACLATNMNRNSFYFWKKRFEDEGIDGLKNKSSKYKWKHPNTTSPEIEDKIITMALRYPEFGCNRLQRSLNAEGIQIHAVTIQKILRKYEIGLRDQRLHATFGENRDKNLIESMVSGGE